MGIKDMYHMHKMAKNRHISIGRIGEAVAEGYLKRRGYLIVARNYRKPWGELDIVAKKRGVLHFVEVKSGSWKMAEWPKEGAVAYRPEDHMHPEKCARMARAVQTYLTDCGLDVGAEWTADLVVVLLNTETRKARVRMYENILLSS
jgi:putative endonuclease